MPRQRKNYTAEFKTKVVLEAIKGQRTLNEIAQRYSIHPNQVVQWKKHALAHLPDAFSDRSARQKQQDEQLKDELYRQIGQLKVELEWLKKRTGLGN
jgi:transposase-like protein